MAYYRALGYDYIKVYSDLTLEVYAAILEEARARGIRVVGHIPARVGLHNVLASGQYSIEHFTGFAERASSTRSIWTGDLDVLRLKELAALIRDAGVWVTPTLAVGLVSPDQVPALLQRPEMRYVSPSLKWWFQHPLQAPSYRDFARGEANMKLVLKTLHDCGVKLLLGVDSGFRYVLPGGRWLSEEWLRERLEEIARSYLNPAHSDRRRALGEPD